jgi:hypothetical protein
MMLASFLFFLIQSSATLAKTQPPRHLISGLVTLNPSNLAPKFAKGLPRMHQYPMQLARFALLPLLLLLSACDGDSHSPWSASDNTPGAVVALAGNAGDGAISVGWATPTIGTAPFNYSVVLSPATTGAVMTQAGTSALIRNLSNGTAYTVAVRASNSAGNGPTASLQVSPSALDSASYASIAVTGNTSLSDRSGIYDPSVLRLASGNIWIAYSSVAFYGSPLVQDVSTSLAFSSDGGSTFNYVRTLGNAGIATVTDTTNGAVCGSTTCSGRWVYEVPFIVDDASDPDAARRFKIFAHKYFLYPPKTPSTFYPLGAIVMWTAPALDGTWSAERSVLGWNLTPPELTPNRVVNTIDPALSSCITVSEGSATTFNGALDFVFACSNGITQKIVQLRSADHANSFTYVGTLLEASDATSFGANYFSAPALITTETNAQLLLATPVSSRTINGSSLANVYSGCVAFPVASEQSAALFRNAGTPLAILQIPASLNRLNGACSFERNTSALGVLMNEATPVPLNFGIIGTRKNF